MKKKIFIASAIVCLLFLAGGIYIIATIETSTTELDRLLKLHQVEILREHLLIRIKTSQSDLYLMGTRYEQSPQTVRANLNHLSRVAVTCFDCHHRPAVVQRLENLNRNIESYKGSVAKILTMTGDPIGIVYSLADITQHRQTEARMQTEQDELQQRVDAQEAEMAELREAAGSQVASEVAR